LRSVKGQAMGMFGAGLLALALPGTGAVTQPLQRGIETRIVAELNRARADPRAYAAELRRYRSYYRGRIVWRPGNPVGLRTREGTAAVDEAIRFLSAQAPLPPLAELPLLARAAADHAADQERSGLQGHGGRDGSRPAERIRRRGGGSSAGTGEVIAYGPTDAASVVRELIIDDGVPDRGHRWLMFSPRFRAAGAACRPHRDWRTVCVIDFSTSPTGR